MPNNEEELGEQVSESDMMSDEKRAEVQEEPTEQIEEDTSGSGQKTVEKKDRLQILREKFDALMKREGELRDRIKNSDDLTNDERNTVKKELQKLLPEVDKAREKYLLLKPIEPVKIKYPILNEVRKPDTSQSDQFSRAEVERSNQEVDDAYWKMRHAELNGDPDDLVEARANYEKLSKEHQRRSTEVRQDDRDFDDQMSGR